MLSSTFIHLPRIGPVTEQRIWRRGICTWSDFLREPTAAGLSPRATDRLVRLVSRSEERLNEGDHRFFASRLPRREHWRAYPEFRHGIAYLDIETTSLEGDDVTLIGLYDGRRTRIYQKGEDLEQFVEDIAAYRLLVTFHGAGFDFPFLRRRFPDLEFHQLHIDLCPTLRRLGLSGGLKNIERALDIPRSPETEHLDGWDAVRLWREWECGSAEALQLLKRYNAEDVAHLENLLRFAYPRLCRLTGVPAASGSAPGATGTPG